MMLIKKSVYIFKAVDIISVNTISRNASDSSSVEVFTKEEMDNRRMEILWKDRSTVQVTISFAHENTKSKEWFQKFIFGFYQSNVLRVNKRRSTLR